MVTGTTVMTDTMTNDVRTAIRGGRPARRRGAGMLFAFSLLLAPYIAARAGEDAPHESAISTHAKSFGEAVKRDTKVVGAKCKEGAHRVAVAAKAVAHEIAGAAKRGAAETRAAFRGEKVEPPAT